MIILVSCEINVGSLVQIIEAASNWGKNKMTPVYKTWLRWKNISFCQLHQTFKLTGLTSAPKNSLYVRDNVVWASHSWENDHTTGGCYGRVVQGRKVVPRNHFVYLQSQIRPSQSFPAHPGWWAALYQLGYNLLINIVKVTVLSKHTLQATV